MSSSEDLRPVEARDAVKSDAPPRRVYDAPAVLSRQPLEAVAAVCGPPSGKQPLVCAIGSS
jgi:hypothetical protein